MRKITLVCSLLLFTLLFGQKAVTQDTSNAEQRAKAHETEKDLPLVHYYHLNFVIEELSPDGKPVNSRTYSTTISTDVHGTMSIRTGARIPIATGSYSGVGDGKAAAIVNTQFQYQDVGINIDVRRAHEVDRQLALDLTADLSGVAESNDPNLHQPVIRQNRWQTSVLIPVGKPSVVFTSDSIDSKGSTRVTVTATPLQ